MESISVMLIDDNTGFLRATTQFLEAQKDITVVGTAESGAEALEKVQSLQPQVILVDLAMPGMPGLETIPYLRQMVPQAGIIALTVMNTNSFRKAALDAGADHFIPKPAMRVSLLPTIRKVAKDGQERKKDTAKDSAQESVNAAPVDRAIIQQRVLLMEDDPSQRRLYARVLHNAGYIVEEAGTLQEARDRLIKNQFGIFLCDIHMGRERGTDLVREQKEALEKASTRIVMISADTQYRSICKEIGVAEYLEKPISLVQLVQTVNRIAGREQ
ncbi:MAG: response regulator [Anaerolineae bacterium]|nr:response regulator [Anaerolineae bacterium]